MHGIHRIGNRVHHELKGDHRACEGEPSSFTWLVEDEGNQEQVHTDQGERFEQPPGNPPWPASIAKPKICLGQGAQDLKPAKQRPQGPLSSVARPLQWTVCLGSGLTHGAQA